MRALPQTKFIGFEPDPEEHERLSCIAKPGYTYVNVAVGGRDEQNTLHVTRNPACSSLLRPNHAFYSQFQDCGPNLEVVGEKIVEVVSLDSFLPKMGICSIDFLDLDTQGSELEILHGARTFLSAHTVGVKCEVEFFPLYLNQSLFGDVDEYLRSIGFMLFDLSRTRYRRANFPPHALTRGQLLWGDAVYLRDYRTFPAQSCKLPLIKLCLLALHLQFHDYALQTLDFLLAGSAAVLTREEENGLTKAREQYLKDLSWGERWIDLVCALERMGLRRPLRLVGRLATQFGDRLRKDRMMTEYNWVD
jgi:FkbM family methyltransferase